MVLALNSPMARTQTQHQIQQDTDIEFFLTTDRAWLAMYHDCKAAKESIIMEQYILRPDIVGMRFLRLFQKKAGQGVSVRLLVDKVGSYELFYSPVLKELRESGVEVFFYNPIGFINLLAPSTWFPRDHAKTLLIDHSIAYAGGVCFDSRMRNWRDTQARFTGAEAQQVSDDIKAVWKRVLKTGKSLSAHTPDADDGITYVASTPMFRRNPLYKALRSEIIQAKKEVCIATPYFIPPRKFVRALKRAVKNGATVKIIITQCSDICIADYVAQTFFHKLYESGIKIYFYNKTKLHAKYLTVDDEFAMIGSTNMDHLSFMHNREANLVIRDPAVAAVLKGHFMQDVRDSEVYTEEAWKKRPIHHKFLGWLFRPFRRIM